MVERDDGRLQDASELDMEELEKLSGGADPETMGLGELNNLIAIYERSFIQCQDMIPSGAGNDSAEETMNASARAVYDLKKIRKSRFGV